MNFRELESNFKKNVFRNEDDIKIYSIEEHSIMDKCNIEFSDVYSL